MISSPLLGCLFCFSFHLSLSISLVATVQLCERQSTAPFFFFFFAIFQADSLWFMCPSPLCLRAIRPATKDISLQPSLLPFCSRSHCSLLRLASLSSPLIPLSLNHTSVVGLPLSGFSSVYCALIIHRSFIPLYVCFSFLLVAFVSLLVSVSLSPVL